MSTTTESALVQQGYDYSPGKLRELEWGLRFTPLACMLGAVVGLMLQSPTIHFVLAALGMLPFWTPAWHPVDRLYNHVLRPMWKGVMLPPNPLPRRIACFMGGAMNIGIGVAFVYEAPMLAWIFGGILLGLQLVVITTHFCAASWMYEMLLRALGRWTTPVSTDRARELLAQGTTLIDVRQPEEFAAGHLPGATNIPLDDVVGALAMKTDKCILLCCRSGLRSQRATQLLKRRGHPAVFNLGAMDRLEIEAEAD